MRFSARRKVCTQIVEKRTQEDCITVGGINLVRRHVLGIFLLQNGPSVRVHMILRGDLKESCFDWVCNCTFGIDPERHHRCSGYVVIVLGQGVDCLQVSVATRCNWHRVVCDQIQHKLRRGNQRLAMRIDLAAPHTVNEMLLSGLVAQQNLANIGVFTHGPRHHMPELHHQIALGHILDSKRLQDDLGVVHQLFISDYVDRRQLDQLGVVRRVSVDHLVDEIGVGRAARALQIGHQCPVRCTETSVEPTAVKPLCAAQC